MRATRLLLLLPLLFLFAPSVLAQIYSWRDAEDKMHYSDQPPAGVANPRKIEPPQAPTEETDKARRKLAKDELDFRKRQLDAEESTAKAAKSEKEAAERQENCKQARSYLQALESGVRISRNDEKGERSVLDDQGREQETASARRAVSSWCTAPTSSSPP